jgi:hypothetical protein
MSGLRYKSSLSLSGLAIPLFALFGSVLFELSLQLTALIKLSLSLGISLALPTIAVALSIAFTLIAQFNIALGLSLPSFNLNFALAISFELTLVLGFKATLEALINAIENASLVAYGWFGSAVDLGASLTTALSSAWPDGTDGDQDVTAFLFVATTGGSYSKDQIAKIALMPVPNPPPTPQHPPPPANSYPPPQAYEDGLAGVSIAPPTSPGGVQATATLTVDNSVATGIGAITGYTVTNHGSGYTSMPLVQVTDTVSIVSATTATPIVVTLPNPLSIPVGQGFGMSYVLETAGDPVKGTANAKVLTTTTIALYHDSGFTDPVAGTAAFTGGTVTGGGAGAAALVTMGGGAVNALQSFLDGLEWPTSTALVGKVISFKAMLATAFGLMIDLDGNLQARANLLGGIKLSVDVLPPSISASLELLAQISANLKANLNVKLPDLTVSAAAALSAQIEAVAKLVARIGFFLGLAAADITLEIWEYQGPGNQFGAAVAAGPGAVGWHDHTGAGTSVTAAVFGLTNPASAGAFSALFPGA